MDRFDVARPRLASIHCVFIFPCFMCPFSLSLVFFFLLAVFKAEQPMLIVLGVMFFLYSFHLDIVPIHPLSIIENDEFLVLIFFFIIFNGEWMSQHEHVVSEINTNNITLILALIITGILCLHSLKYSLILYPQKKKKTLIKQRMSEFFFESNTEVWISCYTVFLFQFQITTLRSTQFYTF